MTCVRRGSADITQLKTFNRKTSAADGANQHIG